MSLISFQPLSHLFILPFDSAVYFSCYSQPPTATTTTTTIMPEHDALVLAYSHLRDFPRAADALQILRRVASLVKPLMRARKWKVRELSEFYPDQANLLGLNINKGQKILLRLRYPGDATLFLPTEQIADTMLHELAHIVHGPHDAIFHSLWNQLRDEHMALAIKGYTGESFLSDGHRLGGGSGIGITSSGHRLSASSSSQRAGPMAEARRLARAAAERRQRSSDKDRTRHSSSIHGGGHRLGGSSASAPPPSSCNDLRRVVAEAVARRNSHTPQTMTGCATDGPQYSDQARAVLVEQASRNGFRTQAEEDAANDAAISQALWELVQEDERRRLGTRYVPPTAEHPEGSGGWLTAQGEGLSPIIIDDDDDNDDIAVMNVPPPPRPPPARRPVSMPPRPTPPPPPPARSVPTLRPRASSSAKPSTAHATPGSSASSRGWSCHVCTLHNPSSFLCCDACGTERRADDGKSKGKEPSAHRQAPPVPHLTHPSRTRPSSSYMTSRPPPPPPKRSSAQASAASATMARVSAMAQHGPHRQQKPKKKVTFTPSTYGGSVTSATSSSARARPPTPPSGSHGSTRRSAPPPPSSSSSASASAQPETWMCTNCWGHMAQQMTGCAQCGKPREQWQGQ